jgi:acyl-coenzyme A thioesterase PaaI-like protein
MVVAMSTSGDADTGPGRPSTRIPPGPFRGVVARRAPNGGTELALGLDRRHLNGFHIVHGGALMSFAFFAAETAAAESFASFAGIVSFQAHFLEPAAEGELVVAQVQMLDSEDTISTFRGMLRVGERSILEFSGGAAW